jgi:Tol biopolymer transport system component
MHVRGKNGGTVYSQEGKLRKINTKTKETTGSAVYGELSSDGRYGIFTTADIIPILHSYRTERLEVYDKQSDLILIDFEAGTVSNNPSITGDSYQETFPCFSADNRTIYFCRAAHLPQPDSTKQMRYDLYSIAFSPETGQLGDTIQQVIDASSRGKSISFPKCSPDGKFLLFTVSDYGTFPIWHPETDLWMLNLSTGEINEMEKTNGRFSDSYHSWSSNSKWIAFASKRDDRVYGRPYFAYVKDDGTTTKAFVLPQKNPELYQTTLKSYNIPELYSVPEYYDAHAIKRLYFNEEAEMFNYKKN